MIYLFNTIIMTKEEILKDKGIVFENWYKNDTSEADCILEVMEEYGKIQWNLALEEAANNADADYNRLPHWSGDDEDTIEVYVIKDSILKLKKT